MARKTRLTTLEKFNNAKKEYDAGIFKTVEEASEAHDICPATYYNYQKKEPGSTEVTIREITTGGDDYNALEISKIIDENKKLRQLVMQKQGKSLPLEARESNLMDRIVDKVVERILSKI